MSEEKVNSDWNSVNERAHYLAKLAPESNWEYDLELNQWWNNEAFEKQFGPVQIPEDGDVVQYWQARIHPQNRSEVQRKLETLADHASETWASEFYLTLAGGNWTYVRAKACVVRQNGRIVRLVGTLEELADSYQYRQYKEQTSLALKAAGVGVWSMTFLTKVITWDEQCQELFDWPEDTMPLAQFLERMHPEDLPMMVSEIQQLRTEGNNDTSVFEFRYLVDHKTICFRLAGKTYFDAGGQIDHFIGTVRDITEEKRKEEALFNIERKFQIAFDHASLGIVMVDTTGKFLLINQAFSQLTGYSPGELYGGSFQLLTHPEDFSRSELGMEALKNRDQAFFTQQKRYIHKDGHTIWVSIHTTLVEAGNPPHFFSIIQDITEEIASREEQKRLLALVEHSTECMAVASLEGELLYINQAGKKLTGIDPENASEKLTVTDFYVSEHYPYAALNTPVESDAKDNWSGEIYIRHRQTREVIPVYASGTLIKEERTGKPIARGFMLRDLRNEQLTQKVLKESESRFRNLVLQAPIAIGLLRGQQMVIETANEAILNLWGKTEAILGKPLLEAMPEFEGQGFIELLRDVYYSGKPFYGNEILAQIIRNGRKEACYFNFVYAPVRDANGLINGVSVVATEITDQIQSKKNLQFSEERFRSFIANSPTPIAIYEGPEMRIRMANQAVLDTWGRDASVIGKTFREVLPELDPQEFYKLLDHVYATGEPYTATQDRVDLNINGKLQTFYFNFSYKALRDANGTIYGIINTATDVTTLVTIQQQLQEVEQNLRSAITLAELGTWSRDLVTAELRFSDRVLDWFGFEKEEKGFDRFMQAVHPDDRSRVQFTVSKALSPGNPDFYSMEFRIIHLKTGEERIVQAQGKVSYNQDGKAILLGGTVRDVTAEKRNEQELERLVDSRTMELQKANDLLQASNQELEQYAYVASHDLQEPLRKIRMFSGIIQDMKSLPEAARSPLTKVISSSERMTLLIKDLLEFSRLLKSDRIFSPTNLNAVIQNVITDFELSIQEKSAQIEIDSLPQIEAIPLQMNQLFYNLISNALKFAEPGRNPTISIRCRMLSPSEIQSHDLIFKSERHYDITIQDNGIGFKEQYKEQIFEVFRRLHTREAYPGSGVGLALCRKIAMNHGGLLWADSEEGRGSAFHVILPEKQLLNF